MWTYDHTCATFTYAPAHARTCSFISEEGMGLKEKQTDISNLTSYRTGYMPSECDIVTARVSEPPGAGVFGWSRSRHFGPAPAPPYIFVK